MPTLSVHSAAQNNQLSLLRALLAENPAQLNEKDGDGRTPLHWASTAPGGIEIVQYLLNQKGIEVDTADPSGWSALHMSSSAGRENVVRELLGAGADPNKANDKGLTPLHYAASKSHISIGQMLIDRGADKKLDPKSHLNSWRLTRKTVQINIHSASTGSVGFVKMLINPPEGRPKTRLNTADRIGNTPLHLAMESGHGEVAVILIEAGADRHRVLFLE
ncbi:hypothetical protein M422DRAFT_44167 [Sphaerobolus stellatus SS14]|nr:hypothetical protein M422DRAFT_44167 [Sphaerobolus stellatus SS14]